MSKVKYDGITFDSDLEVEYYKYIQDKTIYFVYHPDPIQVTRGNSYTPDFICWYRDVIEIVECKGYNPYSKMRDGMIHQVMLSKTEQDLKEYLELNGYQTHGLPVVYRKIKYLKAYGFVDWDFKNPNTIANKRKEKINDLSLEIKDLRDFKKKVVRYYTYCLKIENKGKLTKQQQAWYDAYKEELKQIVEGEKE